MMPHDDFQTGADRPLADTERTARRRWNVIGVCGCVGLAAVLTYVLDTGPLVEWIARHKVSKVDEVIFAGFVLLVLISCFSMGRWIGLSNRLAGSQLVGENGPSPETEELRRTQGRDLMWRCIARKPKAATAPSLPKLQLHPLFLLENANARAVAIFIG